MSTNTWVCPNDGNLNYANYCTKCGMTRPASNSYSKMNFGSSSKKKKKEEYKKIAIIAGGAIALIAMIVGAVNLLPKLTTHKTSNSNNYVVQQNTPAPTQTVIATPSIPMISPKTGRTPSIIHGTNDPNATYYADGRIKTYDEPNGDFHVYVYDENDCFLYRKSNVGSISTYTGDPINDVTPELTHHGPESCAGFTCRYICDEVYSGTGTGRRLVSIVDERGNWTKIGSFEYDTIGSYVETVFVFEDPMDFSGIYIERENADIYSSFNAKIYIEDVWAVEYVY